MEGSVSATRVVTASLEAVEEGAEALKRGQLVAFPTDTVYGVGADAFNERAVERLFEAKLRPKGKPFQLLVGSAREIAHLALDVPDVAWRLADAFFPGGLSLVLRKSSSVPDAVTAGADTVAVRVPNHPVAQALIAALGAPLAATSANLSGQPSPVTADEVYRQLAGRVELIIDGGRCPGGRESSVVDLTGPVPRLLREGAIPRVELEQVCGPMEV